MWISLKTCLSLPLLYSISLSALFCVNLSQIQSSFTFLYSLHYFVLNSLKACISILFYTPSTYLHYFEWEISLKIPTNIPALLWVRDLPQNSHQHTCITLCERSPSKLPPTQHTCITLCERSPSKFPPTYQHHFVWEISLKNRTNIPLLLLK